MVEVGVVFFHLTPLNDTVNQKTISTVDRNGSSVVCIRAGSALSGKQHIASISHRIQVSAELGRTEVGPWVASPCVGGVALHEEGGVKWAGNTNEGRELVAQWLE